ncbi:hypothetical protein ACFV2C_27520 [[Kitasatospora] papulosa]|uniref:hypothetical protein n=1 Tax=[Kitasatospora] papulosa TaxID=1464011 RepID=UPI00368A249B
MGGSDRFGKTAVGHRLSIERVEHGSPISAAHLGTRMGVALPVATAALAQL